MHTFFFPDAYYAYVQSNPGQEPLDQRRKAMNRYISQLLVDITRRSKPAAK